MSRDKQITVNLCYELDKEQTPEVSVSVTAGAGAGAGAGESPLSLRSEPPTCVHEVPHCEPRPTEQGQERQAQLREAVHHSYDQAFGQPRSSIRVRFGSHAGADGHPVSGLITSLFNQINTRKLYVIFSFLSSF